MSVLRRGVNNCLRWALSGSVLTPGHLEHMQWDASSTHLALPDTGVPDERCRLRTKDD
jgi:hypothetical protein